MSEPYARGSSAGAPEVVGAIDLHVDTVLRILDLGHDLTKARDDGYMDLPRMAEGGLSAAFFACCVEQMHVARGTASQRLEYQLRAVEAFCAGHRDLVDLARSSGDVRRIVASGRKAILLCVEGGQAIGEDIAQLKALRARGVVYISLAHFASNAWGDSATDKPIHGGLSPVGREVVREMNRLGMMVDVSHLSDDAFWHTLATSRHPVFASHSSARALTPHPRNLTDDMIKVLAERGGVIGVTWWPEYISTAYVRKLETVASGGHATATAGATGLSAISQLLLALGDDDDAKYHVLDRAGIPFPTLSDVVDHVLHVLAIGGEDYVCIGSDHGAVNFSIIGLEQCSKLQALAEALRNRGVSPQATTKIMGQNILAYMDRVQSA